MDQETFVTALKQMKDKKEKNEWYAKRLEEVYKKERLKREASYKSIWQSLQPIIDHWEQIIVQYLNLLGEQYWGEGNFAGCEKVNRANIQRELSHICIFSMHTDMRILWYVEGRPEGSGFKKRYPFFGVRMKVEAALTNKLDPLFKHSLEVIDAMGTHGNIYLLGVLHKELINAFANGPAYRHIDTDWL